MSNSSEMKGVTMNDDQTTPDTEQGRYFGRPGQCFSIDGDWWHEPGSQGDCCGFEALPRATPTPDTERAARLAQVLHEVRACIRVEEDGGSVRTRVGDLRLVHDEIARLTGLLAERDAAFQRAKFDVEHRHHIHGTKCLCGFDSHSRSRSATEHITGALAAALDPQEPTS